VLGGGHEAARVRRVSTTRPRIIALSDGVAFDRWTGLEWTARDHEVSLAWEDADRHCDALALAERDDWRLPEIDELRAIYQERVQAPCGNRRCRLDPGIRLGGPYVWSATSRGRGTRFYIDFTSSTSLSPSLAPTLVRRVICVRRPST
jgi:hypothetical protein